MYFDLIPASAFFSIFLINFDFMFIALSLVHPEAKRLPMPVTLNLIPLYFMYPLMFAVLLFLFFILLTVTSYLPFVAFVTLNNKPPDEIIVPFAM